MSRKYSHQGYDDQKSDNRPRERPQGPRPKREGPRGRGFGAEREDVFRCRDCSTQRPISQEITAETVCGKCGAALHSCVHCIYFDSSSPNECRKPVEIPLRSKTKGNACPLFSPKIVQEFASDVQKSSDARAAFDALFDL